MDVKYRRDPDETCLVMSEEQPADAYVARILCENQIPGVLETRIVPGDHTDEYHFVVTGCRSLMRYWDRRHVSSGEIYELLSALYRIVKKLEDYLIDADHVVLSPEYLFVGNDVTDVKVCCHPGFCRSFHLQMRELAQFFLNKVDHLQRRGVEQVYEVYRITGNDFFSFEDLVSAVKPEVVEPEPDVEEAACSDSPAVGDVDFFESSGAVVVEEGLSQRKKFDIIAMCIACFFVATGVYFFARNSSPVKGMLMLAAAVVTGLAIVLHRKAAALISNRDARKALSRLSRNDSRRDTRRKHDIEDYEPSVRERDEKAVYKSTVREAEEDKSLYWQPVHKKKKKHNDDGTLTGYDEDDGTLPGFGLPKRTAGGKLSDNDAPERAAGRNFTGNCKPYYVAGDDRSGNSAPVYGMGSDFTGNDTPGYAAGRNFTGNGSPVYGEGSDLTGNGTPSHGAGSDLTEYGSPEYEADDDASKYRQSVRGRGVHAAPYRSPAREAEKEVTVFLAGKADEPRRERILISQDLSRYDTININRMPFVVGKIDTTCDFCIDNPVISRVHARFEEQTGTIYLTDCDSTNGTYINGIRMEPNRRYPIREGDEIAMADLKYIFQ